MHAQTDMIVKHQNWKSYHHPRVSQTSVAKIKMRALQERGWFSPSQHSCGLKSSMLTKTQMKSAGTIRDFMINFTDND